MAELLTLDGSQGEGGGKILRTALSLAVALRRPVRLIRIRARRPRPGLQPQHLAVVRALAEISRAEVTGDALDSTDIHFTPRELRGGEYRFDVAAIKGSAGSVSLVFQSLLLPLAFAPEPSRLTLCGGTHVPWSPPVHYVTKVFLPMLRRAGVQAGLTLKRWGWYPAGGGEIDAEITPISAVRALVQEVREKPAVISGVSAVSRLPRSIAERQRTRALERLAARDLAADITIGEDREARNPGTLLFLATEGAGTAALGRRGLRAETVADLAVDPLLAFLDSGASVDDHLADQLVPFLALAHEPSTFSCPTPSRHLTTVAWVVQQFLPVRIALSSGASRATVRILPEEPAQGRCSLPT